MAHAITATVYFFLVYWSLEFLRHLCVEVHNTLMPIYYPDIKLQSQAIDPLAIEAVKIDAWFFDTCI